MPASLLWLSGAIMKCRNGYLNIALITKRVGRQRECWGSDAFSLPCGTEQGGTSFHHITQISVCLKTYLFTSGIFHGILSEYGWLQGTDHWHCYHMFYLCGYLFNVILSHSQLGALRGPWPCLFGPLVPDSE